ncbi:MAG: tetratricopeptide repeat protein [Syntrophobacteraceae bacterium]|nr:tetratricopeptide repeat protein [Syntrophobacteraceae bacterium]
MDVSKLNQTDIFSYLEQQSARRESLANGALSSGIDLYTKQKYGEAIKEFQRAAALSPISSYAVEALNYMAQAYVQLDDLPKAVDTYKKSLRLDPSRDDIHISLGNLYFFQERYDEALGEYEKAAKLNPTSSVRFSLGQAYMYSGRYNQAEEQFNTVQRLERNKPNGYYGLGQNYAMQGLYSEAVSAFKKAIEVKGDFYDAYAEMGHAYADSGQIAEAREVLDVLKEKSSSLADDLSVHIYQARSPKILFAYPTQGTFPYYGFSANTPVSALDAYLANANTSKTFSMVFQFDKEMDRESVENALNWRVGRAAGSGPGQAYNFGMALPPTEVQINPFPINVYYDSTAWTATIWFEIQQNSSGDGTIDPSHIEFTFKGKDTFGLAMDRGSDQFSGFSRVA